MVDECLHHKRAKFQLNFYNNNKETEQLAQNTGIQKYDKKNEEPFKKQYELGNDQGM